MAIKPSCSVPGRGHCLFKIVFIDRPLLDAKSDVFSNISITSGLHSLPYGKRSEHNEVCMATAEWYPDPNFPMHNLQSFEHHSANILPPYVIEKKPCVFPFIYMGAAHNMCTMNNQFWPWCATAVDEHHNMTEWGYCEMDYCEEGKLIILIFLAYCTSYSFL